MSLDLQPHIKNLVGQIVVDPPRSVEVVQALLILCMWPFPFYSTLSDPSFLYAGLATQISLQIGLHRADRAQEFSSRKQVLEVSDEVRRSTWMACCIVGQMQGPGRLGIPSPVQADVALSSVLDGPSLDCPLTALYRISRLATQFSSLIGASARSPDGLLAPAARIEMVRFFSGELDSFRKSHTLDSSLPIKIAYLTARLQLYSFILHDDISRTQDVIQFYYQAEEDAIASIQLATEQTTPGLPFHLVRAVLYSALVLIEILASPFSQQPKTLYDQVQLAAQYLTSAIRVEDDHASRWSNHLRKLVTLRDLKRTPPIRSRMAASLMYNAIRIMKEHRVIESYTEPESLMLVNRSEMEISLDNFDLDIINWDELEKLF